MCAHKMNVHLFRRDSLSSSLDYEGVRHMWVQNGFINIAMGEHGEDKHYAMWPVDQIDHILMEETEPPRHKQRQ
jgi:hypothetical protein